MKLICAQDFNQANNLETEQFSPFISQGLNMCSIVNKLAKVLCRNRSLYDVVPITSAKVPIVKLKHRHFRMSRLV